MPNILERELSSDMCVTAMGMVSPVGFSARQTCAAIRARVGRFRELEGVIDSFGEPVVAAKSDPPPQGSCHSWSLTSMAVMACDEALLELSEVCLTDRKIDLAILLKEEQRPGKQLDAAFPSMMPWSNICTKCEMSVHWYPGGNASGIKALEDAQRRLIADPWRLQLLLGADTLIDTQALGYLETAGRLKAPCRPRGAIPGEAAICLAVESLQAVRARGATHYCKVKGIGEAFETAYVGCGVPCLGTGLTSAIESALHGAGWVRTQVEQVYCDLNGEEYRAHEWMLARCRSLSHPKVTHPADCIGDVGAAFVPLLIGMAAMAFRRAQIAAQHVLVFCSSDGGQRGAVCLSAV